MQEHITQDQFINTVTAHNPAICEDQKDFLRGMYSAKTKELGNQTLTENQCSGIIESHNQNVKSN